jgi:hypothetical protein
MVDIVITPGNVIAGEGADIDRGTAGATILAGQVVYLNETTKRYALADNNAASPPEIKIPRGIALHGASNGQPLAVLRAGEVTIGATIVAGGDYYLGDTAGGICPRADVTTGETVSLIGLAKSTTVLIVNIQRTAVTL